MVLAAASTSKKLKEDSPEPSAAARNFLAATIDRGSISDAPTKVETWGGLATSTDRGDVNFEAPPAPIFSSAEALEPTRVAIDSRPPRTETKPTFFSADNSGRPENIAAVYGGAKGQLQREVEAFRKKFPIRTVDTPVDRPLGRGMGDRWEGPQSDASSEVDWRPRTVEVGRIASTDGRGLFNDRRDEPPSTRPILARDRVGVRAEGQGSASRLGGRTGGRVQQLGVRQTGTGTDARGSASSWFAPAARAASSGTGGVVGGFNRAASGINQAVDAYLNRGSTPAKSQMSFIEAAVDDVAQRQQPLGVGKGGVNPFRGMPGYGTAKTAAINVQRSLQGKPTVGFNPRTLEKINPGGFQSGPTELGRRFLRASGGFAKGAASAGIGYVADRLSEKYLEPQAEKAGQWLGEKLVPVGRFIDDVTPGVNSADEQRRLDRGNIQDQLVDEMGNIKTDVQSRQLRQAGLGTDIRGNIVSENQRIKAVDDFIAGVENWEPLTDQSTFEDIPVAPAAETENTAPVGSAFNKDNLPGWFQHSYTDDDGTFMGYNYSGGFGALTPGSGGGELGTPESGYGTPGYNWDTNSGGTSWTFTDYDTYSSANKSPVVSDVGTVNDLGEVVPNAGDLSGLGVTNQPVTVDLNQSTPLPPAPPVDEFLDEYIPPSQPYDQQEPVGNYIKNEETGQTTQIDDAPTPGVLPSQQEIAGDWKYVSTYRPSAQLQSLWRARDAAIQRENREWNQGNPAVGFDLGPGMRATEKASKAFSDLEAKESAAHQKLTPEQGGDYWAAPGESYNVPWGGFPKGTTHWVFQKNN